jgi:hypothetical protein
MQSASIETEKIPMTWITSDPQAAKALKKADKVFEAARIAAKSLPLAEAEAG